VAGLALVALGFGVAGVMAAFAAGAALALLHSLWIVRDARLWQGRGWFNRNVMSVTAPLFVGMLGPALMLNLDILGLKLLAPVGRGDELAGFYQAAVILARIPIFTARSLTMVVFSYVAGASRLSNPPDYARAAARLWQRLLVPAGLALAIAPQAALAIFFPPAYAAALPALRIAALGGILLSLVTLLTGIAQAAGKRRASAWAAGIATLVQVVVLLWLVPRWGIVGAAASLVAAGVVALAGLAPLFAPRRAPAPAAVWRQGWPLLALIVPLLLLPDGTRLFGLLKYATAGLAYLLALAAAQGFLPGQTGATRASGGAPLMARFVDVLIGG
jgi:O-antigen/teichoic acid export membrane protein